MTLTAGGSSLDASVLVLNRFYIAVHVIRVRRAVCLLFRELAEVIHVEEGQFANYDFESWLIISDLQSELNGDGDDWVRSVNFRFQPPRVIRLYHFDRLPKKSVRLTRRNVFARDGNHCMYCNKRFSASELSIDHVVPKSRGGATAWENVVSSCVRCNVRKGGRTPKEARMQLLKQPVRPKRSPLLGEKMRHPKYESWKAFLGNAHASVEVF